MADVNLQIQATQLRDGLETLIGAARLDASAIKNLAGSYTDAEARAAQASLLTTGTSILFDRPRYYGYPTAATGNITFDFTGSVSGQSQHIRHNSGTKPTLPASANKLSGDYVLSVDNQIYLTPWLVSTSPDVWRVDVTVSQDNSW